MSALTRCPPLLELWKERDPLAAPRRYYPGFFGALFLVLLRTAIGWHFFYEGVSKINSTPSQRDSAAGWLLTRALPTPHDYDKDKEPPFSAEGYLRNSTGPLAPYFRGMLPDVNSLAKLDRDPKAGETPTRLKEAWRAEMDRLISHYQFDADQKAKAQEILDKADAEIDAWFLSVDNSQSIQKYYRELRNVMNVEQSPESMPFQRMNAGKARKELDKERRRLVGEIDAIYAKHFSGWQALATKDQLAAHGAVSVQWTSLDWINLSTMWGLVMVGACLMLGLFTPLAALGGCAYLLMFYLSMPPWPGLPVGPAAEGHYLYVNKNLIELLACLVLASTPNGLWIGLDALFFGRSKRDRQISRPPTVNPTPAPAPIPVGGSFKRKPSR